MIYEPATINWDTWVEFRHGYISMWSQTPLFISMFVVWTHGRES